ncbi:MAG: hypothetical protein U1E06_24095 [Tabrizicola sp.]|uniref:hypothetical protein n=1 Tax=Tabrizicola sp. TaxID=2005166 RepID=UPI00273682AF|nr:hypothetical protein [Tabrizicola sp.]MDP3261861.1 hypothetical protein [Tabrizicola sp.]MDP3649531.1 hypothetical protein [Paracoccaceae bacterium]MDZ4069884.1 hypothetical protein [Tabrizicola sp.]
MKFFALAAQFGALIVSGTAIAAFSGAFVTPTSAQESGIAQVVFDTFVERCTAVLSDPDAAVAAAEVSETAEGAVTGDKALLRYSELLKLSEFTTGFLTAMRTRLPEGTESNCGVSITFLPAADGTVPFPELLDLAGAKAETILGAPATRSGGETREDGEIGHMILWSTGGGPNGPILSLIQYPKKPKIVYLGIVIPSSTN